MQLSVRDAAGIFNVPEKTVFQWIRQRNLPAYKINDQYRFNRSELLEWATTTQTDITSDIITTPSDERERLPRLDEALKTGGVNYDVPGTDKFSVLQAVVDLMSLTEDVDRSFLRQILLSREALGSTAVGNGIAIPHVRNPIVLHISSPMVSLCYLKHPVDFGALDGRPVHILFTLISPTVRTHLHLLSKLSFALSDPAFRSVVMSQRPATAIFSEAARIEDKIQNSIHSQAS